MRWCPGGGKVADGGRTKVALVLEATQGGTRRHVMDLVLGLPRERFEVIPVVSPRPDGEFQPDLERMWTDGIKVEVIPMRREPSPVRDLVALFRMWRLFRRVRPDVVHAHGSKGGLLGRFAARLAGVRRVYHTPHVYPFQWARSGVMKLVYLVAERLLWRLSTKVVAVGKGQAEVALSMRVAAPERLAIIPNGVDPDRFDFLSSTENRREVRAELGLEADELAVGMVARLAPQKGCGHFLRAARIVAEKHPRARFLLIGAGPLLPSLHALSADLGIRERVMFLGHRPDADRLYAGLDIFVLSSLWEGLPYVLLEAQASGLAVVASRIPGCTELVQNGETGYLVELRNEAEISERICELLSSPQDRATMGARGRERVRGGFRLDEFLEKHAALYEGRL
jgi:glycosyltransferase involved in cell wall biosynthesis